MLLRFGLVWQLPRSRDRRSPRAAPVVLHHARQHMPKEIEEPIGGRQFACGAQQIEILGGVNKELTEISFSSLLTPPIVKRKTTLSDSASGKTTQETLAEVFALDVRHRVLGHTRRAYRVQTMQPTDRGATTTVAVHVPEIPGEVVEHLAKKLDSQGRLERSSRLELVGYGIQPDESQREVGGRRARRHKRGR